MHRDEEKLRAYLSNIRAQWPEARQEALLDERAPGWRKGAVYRDELPPARRRAHDVGAMQQRAFLLRPNARMGGETIHVASVSVIAWDQRDLLGVLADLQGRRATLVALAEDLTIKPGVGAKEVREIAEAFTVACRRKTSDDPRRAGALASRAVRMAKAEAGCDRIRERWKLPTKSYPTDMLLKEAGVSLPTAKSRLGPRPEAQRRHVASLEQAVRNMRRRKNDVSA